VPASQRSIAAFFDPGPRFPERVLAALISQLLAGEP